MNSVASRAATKDDFMAQCSLVRTWRNMRRGKHARAEQRHDCIRNVPRRKRWQSCQLSESWQLCQPRDYRLGRAAPSTAAKANSHHITAPAGGPASNPLNPTAVGGRHMAETGPCTVATPLSEMSSSQ